MLDEIFGQTTRTYINFDMLLDQLKMIFIECCDVKALEKVNVKIVFFFTILVKFEFEIITMVWGWIRNKKLFDLYIFFIL